MSHMHKYAEHSLNANTASQINLFNATIPYTQHVVQLCEEKMYIF